MTKCTVWNVRQNFFPCLGRSSLHSDIPLTPFVCAFHIPSVHNRTLSFSGVIPKYSGPYADHGCQPRIHATSYVTKKLLSLMTRSNDPFTSYSFWKLQ